MNAKANNHKAKRADRKNTDKESLNSRKKLDFSKQIGIKTKRKLKARHNPTPGIWLGLGMMGVIGWSVVIPTLLGAALGSWLDDHYAARHSWTLTLLIAGLILGCFNAWYWVDKEHQAMRDKQDHKGE